MSDTLVQPMLRNYRTALKMFEARMLEKYGKEYRHRWLIGEREIHTSLSRAVEIKKTDIRLKYDGQTPVTLLRASEIIAEENEKRENESRKAKAARRTAEWAMWEAEHGKVKPTTTPGLKGRQKPVQSAPERLISARVFLEPEPARDTAAWFLWNAKRTA